MKRSVALLVLIALVCMFLLPHSARADKADVLLVYHTSQQKEKLTALISACGKTVEAIDESVYRQGTALTYDFIVTTSQQPLEDAQKAGIRPLCIDGAFESTSEMTLVKKTNRQISLEYGSYTQPPVFETEATLIGSYSGEAYGSVMLGGGEVLPFAVFTSSQVSVPYTEAGALGAAMLGGVMQRYFGQNENGKMYVLIDEIYPFSDFYMINATTDALHKNAIPFIFRIMPVYDNLDYPAFLRYAQMLRYVQSRGGTVVIHDPIVLEFEQEREPITIKLARLHNKLDEQKIDWLEMKYPLFPLSLDSVTQIQSGGKSFGELPINTAIVISLPEDAEQLETTIDKLNRAWLSIEDYKRLFTDKSYRYDEQAVDADYVYTVAQQRSFVSFFAASNEVLLIFVLLSLVLLLILIFFGIRLYRRKFSRENRP